MNLITCNASYGIGGLGNLLADAIERARGLGKDFRYIAGGVKRGDETIGAVLRSKLAPLINRLPPMRFDAGQRQWWTFECFDRAVARWIDATYDGVLAFAGQARSTFEAARRFGAPRLELLSPTAHINHVWRQHRVAQAHYPIERDWLSARHRDKVLAEYEMADAIHVVSEYARQTFLDECVAAEKLQRVPMAAKARFHEVNRDGASDGRFRIVYTGALSVVKGVPLLIEAFERLATPDAELILIGGSGSRGMRKFLQRACERDQHIRIVPGDPLPHLRGADVYVHPSYQDGYSYAVLEALACGVPVILTEDTGAKENVIEGVNGWIVSTGNVDAIHQRLQQFIASTRSGTRACAS